MRQHPLVGDIVAGFLKFVAFLLVGAVGLGVGLFSFLQVIGFRCGGGFQERCTTTANPAVWLFAWAILGVVTIAVLAAWYFIFSGWRRRGDIWLGAAAVAMPIASVVVDELVSGVGVAVWLTAFCVVGLALTRARGGRRGDAPASVDTKTGTSGSGVSPMVKRGG